MSGSEIIALVVGTFTIIAGLTTGVWVVLGKVDRADAKLWAEINNTRGQVTAFEKDASDRFARITWVQKMFDDARMEQRDMRREILDAIAGLAKEIATLRDNEHRRGS